jgi:hypothetical protein
LTEKQLVNSIGTTTIQHKKSAKAMKKFQQIIDLCNEEFGERVLYTEIEQKETGSTLHISLDASHEAENNVFYPTIKDGELKVLESWSNTLHLFMQANNKTKFYYQGYIHTDSTGKKYSEPVDGDGVEIEADTIFSLDVNSPEEAIEWLQFIFRYRDGSILEEDKSIRVEELPTSNWFEEPLVFLPGVTDKLVRLNKVMESFNVFDLPALFNKAYVLGDESAGDMGKDHTKSESEIEEMNRQGEAELDEIGRKFGELAAGSTDRPQTGDFLVIIGAPDKPIPWSSFRFQGPNAMEAYFLVLRPANGNSFTALHDFLRSQLDGYKFYKDILNPDKGMPDTMRFIPDIETQRQYVLKKKIALTNLQGDLDFFRMISLNPEESLKRIGEARQRLLGLIHELLDQE